MLLHMYKSYQKIRRSIYNSHTNTDTKLNDKYCKSKQEEKWKTTELGKKHRILKTINLNSNI